MHGLFAGLLKGDRLGSGRGGAAALLLACCVFLASTAYAQSAERRYSFDIEAATLGHALESFVKLTGARLIYPEKLASEGGVNAVIGQYTLSEALDVLLKGTEFSGGLTKGGVIVISLKKTVKPEKRGAEVTKSKLKTSLLGGMAALFSISGAYAQTDEDGKPIDTVVVTGSRVARSGFDTPTPTTVISSEQIEETGLIDTGSIIMQNPQISVGLGATNDTFQRDIGSSFINLRGLGENRTLVLIDGRRRVSGSREGSQVDLSAIPPSMIESIEIITGGASAVYGADAVSGVVNIKLKKDIEGLEATVRGGISQEGDAGTYSASLAGGGAFSESRGHVSFGVTVQKTDEVKYTDRDYAFGNGALRFVNNPANTGPADGIPDRLIMNGGGTISSAYQPSFLISGQRYIYDQGIQTIDMSKCYSTSCFDTPYGYNNKERNLRTPSRTISGISDLTYEIAPNVNMFAGMEFSNAITETNGQSFFDSGLVVKRDNPFLPSDLAALMDTQGVSQITVGMEQEDLLGNKWYTNERNTFTVDAGFEGNIAERFDWQVFYQYGQRRQNYSIANTRIESRYYQALDPIVMGGEIVCADPDARAAGCVPINLFSPTPASEADKAYFAYTMLRNVRNTQSLAGFQITGPLLELPAGPLSVALGGEYRKDGLVAYDDGLAERGELYRTDQGAKPVDASVDVKEAFVEAVAPILKDAFFAKTLEIEGAMRFSDYSSIGSTLAWKAAGSWEPIEDIRIRVTRSRSVRAPNIMELYGPESRGTLNITNDPCDVTQINLGSPTREANCRALGVPVGWVDPAAALALTTITGGNANLSEETSNSWTIGGVITPRFIPGLRLSVDWWKMEIDDAIQTLDGNTIVDNCVDSPTLNNAFCPFVTRGNLVGLADPYVVSRIDLRQVNIGQLSASGIDMSAAYRFDLEALSNSLAGGVNFNASLVYLGKLEELVDATDASSLVIRNGEYDNPTWRGRFSTSYHLDGLTVAWNMRYLGSSSLNVQATREYNVVRVDSRLYHDLFFSYELPSEIDVQFGVNNLMNSHPPRTPSTYTGTFAGSLYENIGRNFYLSLSKKF